MTISQGEKDRQQEIRDTDELLFQMMLHRRREQMKNPPILSPLPTRELDATVFEEALDKATAILGLIPAISLTNVGAMLEATYSAQIESMQVDADMIADYHKSNQDHIITDDLREAYNYLPALNHCVDSMDSENGLPLSGRLLCEAHGLLFAQSTRADYSQAGQFRTIQNYIGNGETIVYMPPAPGAIQDLMTNLETYCHDNEHHALVKAAILHVQFESIHPFVDGNGRIGRLLIALYLYEAKLICAPGFYLSRHFLQRQMEYYTLLNKVREDNGWERWIKFFLDGVCTTTQDAIERFGR